MADPLLGGHGYRYSTPFRVQKLLLVLVPEVTEPTSYRLDGDKGDEWDTDFLKRLTSVEERRQNALGCHAIYTG